MARLRLPLLPAHVVPVAATVATALAAWFALRHLGREPFGRDEVATVTNAHRSLSGTLDVARNREGNMWAYYVLQNAWTHLGGTGEGWVRLPGALCAVASVPVLMVVAYRLFGTVAAVIAGVVLACSPMLEEAAQFARSYGVLALLTAVGALLLLRAVEQPLRGRWIAWAVVSGLMVHLHMVASLVVVAEAASLLLLPPGAIAWRAVRPAAIVFALLVAPMAIYAAVGDSGQTSWIPAISADAIAGFAKAASGSRPLAVLMALLALALAADLVTALRAGGRSAEAWRRGLVLLWVALPPLMLAAVSVVKPLFSPTYLIGVVPGVALLAGATSTSPVLRRAGVPAAALVALVALATQLGRSHPVPADEDLRGAAAFVAARSQAGDGLAFAPAFARPGFAFYFDQERMASRPRPRDLDLQPGRTPQAVGDLFGEEAPPARVAANLRAARRVWLVGYPGSDWHPTPEPVLANGRILREEFQRVERRRFGELTVQLYRHR